MPSVAPVHFDGAILPRLRFQYGGRAPGEELVLVGVIDGLIQVAADAEECEVLHPALHADDDEGTTTGARARLDHVSHQFTLQYTSPAGVVYELPS